MKRVVIRTSTEDRADGTTATQSERIEEENFSGLLEAWGALILALFTFFLFLLTYRIVSTIHLSETNDYAIQTRQR